MKVSRPTIDTSIISFEGPNVLLQYNGSDALYRCHRASSQLFIDAYTCDKTGRIIIAHNDQGITSSDVYNIFDYKHLAHKCFPDHDFSNHDYDLVCITLQKLGNQHYEYDKLYWSGTAQSTLRKKFMDIKSDRIISRDLLSQFGTHINEEEVRKLNLREEQSKYKYIIEIPGGVDDEEAGSYRIKYLLHSKRLIFLVERQLYDWVSCKMVPFVHYIPVKDDFSDLFEKIEWADTHPEEVEQIITNATKLAPFRNDAINQIKLLLN